MTPTEVCITVDTELDIDGSLRFPERYEPLGVECLWRTSRGRSHGLGFILDTLERFGLRGTFFIEVMSTHYFGDAPMRSVAEEIAARGHDLQLHVHPCWRFLAGRKAGTVGPDEYTDAIVDFTGDGLVALLEEGRDIFARLVGHPPLAFRSGSLLANRELFAALATAGFRISSTLAVGVYRPVESDLHIPGGLCRIDGVTELPVLAYRTPLDGNGPPSKAATVIGSSLRELTGLLEQAAARNAGPFTILTHASELSGKIGPHGARRFAPWPRKQRRFAGLCRFLAERPERFRVVTFSERHAAWAAAPAPATAAVPLRSGPLGLGIRLFENNLLPRLGLH